jgi:thymidylate synthase (FAD)
MGLDVAMTTATLLDRVTFRTDVTVELIASSASDELVAAAAWVSTQADRSKPDHAQDPVKLAGLIKYLAAHRHGSPFEHSTFTFFVQAPIFVWREHHRHRIASYNEESGRYKQLDPVFYEPSPERNLVNIGTSARPKFGPGTPEQYQRYIDRHRESCVRSYRTYQASLDDDVAKEVARIDLPFAIYSSCYVTINARSLMNFLSLRTHKEDALFVSYPQQEIEYVADQYEGIFAGLMPLTYGAFLASKRVAP